MAIFKPEVKSTPSNYLGLCKFGILEFRDRSSEFDWADIFERPCCEGNPSI